VALDAAERTLLDGLDHESSTMRIKAAANFLSSSAAGRRRGFGRRAKCNEAVKVEPVTIKWMD
jgi:hypothetical protein